MNLLSLKGAEVLFGKFFIDMKPLKLTKCTQAAQADSYVGTFFTQPQLKQIQLKVNKKTAHVSMTCDDTLPSPIKTCLNTYWGSYAITTDTDLDTRYAAFKTAFVALI